MVNILEDLVTSPLRKTCEDAMLDMFSNYNKNIWDASDNISVTPATWGGGSVYNLIETIHKNALLPIGVVLLTIFLYWEIYQMVIENNNGSDSNEFNIFRWIIVAFLGVTMLKYSMDIVMSFFDMGEKLVSSTVGSGITSVNATMDFTKVKDGLETKNFFDLIWLLIGLKFSGIVLNLISLFVWAFIQLRMIQIYFYAVLASIPMSTFASKEFRNIGFNYLKNLMAYALQGVLIIMSFSVYRIMLQEHMKNLTSVDGSGAFMMKIIILGLVLVIIIRQTSVIAKSVVDAH